MPKFVRPTKEQYEKFFNVYSMFRRLSLQEKIDRLTAAKERRDAELAFLGFVPKHSEKIDRKLAKPVAGDGFEEMYVYELFIKDVPFFSTVTISLEVLTTMLVYKGDVRIGDVTKIIIRDSRYKKPVYYTPSILRTGNYFGTLEKYCNALLDLMMKYPCCENCGTPRPIKLLKLDKKKSLESQLFSYYFGLCVNCLKTMKGYSGKTLSFYHALEKTNVDFLSSIYKRYSKSRDRKFEKTGEYPVPRVFLKSESNKKEEGERYERVYNDGPHTD